MEDERIIELYFERKEQAIEETQKTYGKYCYHIAWNILFDREDADECVNDTWFRAWRTIPPKHPDRLSLFPGTITRNLSLDCWKRKHARKRGMGTMELALEELEEYLQTKIPEGYTKEAQNCGCFGYRGYRRNPLFFGREEIYSALDSSMR